MMRDAGAGSGATELKPAHTRGIQQGGEKYVPPEMIILLKKRESDNTATYAVYLAGGAGFTGALEIDKEALRHGGLLRDGQPIIQLASATTEEDMKSRVEKAREAINRDPEKWKHSKAWGRTTSQVKELYYIFGITNQNSQADLLKVDPGTISNHFRKMVLKSEDEIEEEKTWKIIEEELGKLPKGTKPNAMQISRDKGIPHTTIISQLKKHEVKRHAPGGREKPGREETETYVGNAMGNATWAEIKPHVEESIRSGTQLNGSAIARKLSGEGISIDMALYHIRKRKKEIEAMRAKIGKNAAETADVTGSGKPESKMPGIAREAAVSEAHETDKRKARGEATWKKIKPVVEERIRNGDELSASKISGELKNEKISRGLVFYYIRTRTKEIEAMRTKIGKSVAETADVTGSGEPESKTPVTTKTAAVSGAHETDKRKARGEATWNKIKPFVEESICNGTELKLSEITRRLSGEKISKGVVFYHLGKRKKEIEMMRLQFEAGKTEEADNQAASSSAVATTAVEKAGGKAIKTPGLSTEEEAKLDAAASKGLIRGTALSEDSGVSYYKTKRYMKTHGIELKRGRPVGEKIREVGGEVVAQTLESESEGSEEREITVVQSGQEKELERVVRKEVAPITTSSISPVSAQAPRMIPDLELVGYAEKTVPVSIPAALNKIRNGLLNAADKEVIEIVTEEVKKINKAGKKLFSEKTPTELTPEAMKPLRERLIEDDDFLMENGHHPVTVLIRMLKEVKNEGQIKKLYDDVQALEPRANILLQALNDKVVAEGYY